MSRYFGYQYLGGSFVLFSSGHDIALGLIVGAVLLIILFKKQLREERANKWFRYFWATFLLLSEISLWYWYKAVNQWSIANSLPLHLCSISLLLSVVMLYRKSYALFEFVYLAGLGGDIEALLTPDLGWYSFPHYIPIQFFVSHGGILVACMFMVFVERYKPTKLSLWRTLRNLNLVMLPVAFIDWLTGGDYMYLRMKPEGASLFDYLGPWPWYIVSLEFVAILSFAILYAPFVVQEWWAKRRERGRM